MPPRPKTRWENDKCFVKKSAALIGIDEAGRGAFAGPVVAAAVWVDAAFYRKHSLKDKAERFRDSKMLSARRRRWLRRDLEIWENEGLVKFQVGTASPFEIDQINILEANTLAMRRALEALIPSLPTPIEPAGSDDLFADMGKATTPRILVDGRPVRNLGYSHEALVGGDNLSVAIAMASIVAKTFRDAEMESLGEKWPQYGFSDHSGYGTENHHAALIAHGPCPAHRRTFIHKLALSTAPAQPEFHFNLPDQDSTT